MLEGGQKLHTGDLLSLPAPTDLSMQQRTGCDHHCRAWLSTNSWCKATKHGILAQGVLGTLTGRESAPGSLRCLGTTARHSGLWGTSRKHTAKHIQHRWALPKPTLQMPAGLWVTLFIPFDQKRGIGARQREVTAKRQAGSSGGRENTSISPAACSQASVATKRLPQGWT